MTWRETGVTWRETDVTWQETDVAWQETDAALEKNTDVGCAGRAGDGAFFLKYYDVIRELRGGGTLDI